MENIILAVVPVLESSIIGAGLLDGSGRLHNFLGLRCGPLPLLALELGFVCGSQVHTVGVYDLAFLFKVECLLVGLHLGLSELSVVILAIIGEKCFWIRVTDESVSTPGHSCTLVPSGKRLVYTKQYFD